MATDTPAERIRTVSLKFWLPVVVVSGGVLLILVLLVMQLRSFERNLDTYVNQTLYDDAARTLRAAEVILQRGDLTDLDALLSKENQSLALQHAILLDQQGVVVAASDAHWKQQPVTFFPSYLQEQVRALQQGQAQKLVLDTNHHRLLVSLPIALAADQQGILLKEYNLEAQVKQLWQVIRHQTLVFLVVLFLIALAITIFVQKQVMQPVRMLSQGMRNIGLERYDAIPDFVGEGEFKALHTELGAMAFHLATRSASLAAREARYRQLSDASQEVIVFHDNGIVVEANAMLKQVLGYRQEDIIGRPIISFIAPHHQKLTVMRMEKYNKGVWVTDVVDAAGEIVTMEVSVNQQEVDGRIVRVIAGRDIRERLQAQEEIRRLSHYDVLTGLANRSYLMKQVALELQEVERLSMRAALVAININGFKAINDSLGMAAGDEVLRLMARRLSALLNQGQVLARVEGDTFAVLITRLDQVLERASAQTVQVVEGLLEAVKDPFIIQEQELAITAGAGVVMIPNDSADPAELLREAETAMHQAKNSDDEQIHFFAHALQIAANERLVLRNELRQAISANDQLVLHYQPQVGIDGKLHGVEALVRWQHPTKGMIPPLDFIVEAENNGLIVPLGNWVLQEAAQTLKQWQQEDHPWANSLSMAVNVSPRQFREKDFVSRIEDVIAGVGVEAVSFELELTEMVVADDLEQTLEKMERLRQFGVRFALDDFGTGYSSLSYLKRLPIDTLKIDRSFVMDIDTEVYGSAGKRPAVLIDAIVAMAHQLGMEVLAEGVETAAQFEYLRKAGCDYYQGYYFSKPMSDHELLTRNNGQNYLI